MEKLNIFTLALVSLASGVYASTLYVAPDEATGTGVYGYGDSESDALASCTMADPCGLPRALSEARDGDTVKLAGGEYTGNLVLEVAGLTLTAADDADRPTLIAADTANPNNQNVPLLLAQTDITVSHIDIVLGPLNEDLGQRDLGVFVTPNASDATLSGVSIHRDGSRLGMEPAEGPGSRGVLVFVADGVTIEGCEVTGPWQDGIHLPSVNTAVHDCEVYDSTRVGVVVIQEFPDSDNSGHSIQNVTVGNFGVDGIQIQGDNTIVEGCTVRSDSPAVYGIHVCSPELFDSAGDQAICVPPVAPVCAADCVETSGTCGGEGFGPTPGAVVAECCNGEDECRVESPALSLCVPKGSPQESTSTGSIATCRRDVAEGVTLKDNNVDAANLKQAIVAPEGTEIA